MKEIDSSKPVMVTGGSGYIASWIIKYLLEEGRTVRASVRSLSRKDKVAHLQEIADKSTGTLELFEADLMKSGSFTEAMQDCELVMHTASPFIIGKIKDPQKDLIDPALQGTRNVLGSANAMESVKRVVLTSSVVSVYGDSADVNDIQEKAFNETHWNTSSTARHQPYSYSKAIAEKEAWKMAEAQDRWDLVVINPGFVMGPSLSNRKDGASIDFMIQLAGGRMKMGCPDLAFALVDVRDIARAHVLAGNTPSASGRHIIMNRVMSILEMAEVIRARYGKRFPLPKKNLPKFLLNLVGPMMGFSWKFIRRNVGHRPRIDNAYGIKDLGLKYRPVEETLPDTIEQLVASGHLKG